MKQFFLKIGMVAIGLALSGCASSLSEPKWDLPGERHKITVKETSERLNLVVSRNDPGLSVAQKTAIYHFVVAWRQNGHGPIGLSVPSNSKNARTVVSAADETRKLLYAAGVAWEQIVDGQYQASGITAPPVKLSFRRYVASAENCSVAWQNMAFDYSNKTSRNFGCAVAINTAAMIADPYDLAAPSALGPVSSDRRLVTFGKYLEGETTGVTRSSDEEGSVSDAVD